MQSDRHIPHWHSGDIAIVVTQKLSNNEDYRACQVGFCVFC